jgi:hydrogenase-4 component B
MIFELGGSVPIELQLGCVAALLAIAVLAVFGARRKVATQIVYALTMIVCAAAAAGALAHLLVGGRPVTAILPIGLPWIGAHFRLDALAAFFLFVINFGGFAASFYALGYGRHEAAPGRVLPFFAAFLAGMNLVLLADDAFSFLLSWELMSVTSWALVISHHADESNRRAGYIYLLMASFGTIALLLAFGILAGAGGSYAFDAIRGSDHTPRR